MTRIPFLAAVCLSCACNQPLRRGIPAARRQRKPLLRPRRRQRRRLRRRAQPPGQQPASQTAPRLPRRPEHRRPPGAKEVLPEAHGKARSAGGRAGSLAVHLLCALGRRAARFRLEEPAMSKFRPTRWRLIGFTPLLAEFYRQASSTNLWRKVRPAYEKEMQRYHSPILSMTTAVDGYLRVSASAAIWAAASRSSSNCSRPPSRSRPATTAMTPSSSLRLPPSRACSTSGMLTCTSRSIPS